MITTSKTYRTGEIAAETGVSVEAVRYYERIGLVPKPPRTASGTRRYPHDAVDRIRFVKQAQSNGLSLADIRALVTLAPRGCRQVRGLLAAKIVEIDRKQAQLEEFRRTLQTFADACERSLRRAADPACPIVETIGRARS
jgi:DNA-binding transcriptional MerR regulator